MSLSALKTNLRLQKSNCKRTNRVFCSVWKRTDFDFKFVTSPVYMDMAMAVGANRRYKRFYNKYSLFEYNILRP